MNDTALIAARQTALALRADAIRDAHAEARHIAAQYPVDESALFLAEMYAEQLEAERVNS